MTNTVCDMTWQVLSSVADCNQLLNKFGEFHDSCLREMHLWTEHFVDDNLSMSVSAGLDSRAKLLFQRQFREPSAIELLFEEIVELRIEATEENYDSIILDADVQLIDGLYQFDADGIVRIASRRLSWRDASQWMGSTLHYGGQEQALP
jgi:hypothetical protein